MMWIFHPTSDLTAFHHGELVERAAQRVRAHVDGCEVCRLALEDVRFASSHAGSLSLQSSTTRFEMIESRIFEPEPRARALFGPRRTALFALAAAGVLIAGIFIFRPTPPQAPLEIRLRATPGEPTIYERRARELHESFAAGRGVLELQSSDSAALNRWVLSVTGLALELSASNDEPLIDLVGASAVSVENERAAVVRFGLGASPVTLLVTRRHEGSGAVTPGVGTKEIRYRAGPQTLTWSRGDQTYVLVSELSGFGSSACFVCHTRADRREEIARMHLLP